MEGMFTAKMLNQLSDRWSRLESKFPLRVEPFSGDAG